MALIVAQEREFSWPVSFRQPVDGGTFAEVKLELRFRVMRNKAFRSLVRQILEVDQGGLAEEDAEAKTLDAFERFVAGWEPGQVVDEAKAPVPYSREALAEVLDMPGAAKAILDAYRDAISGVGREERRRGN